MRVLDVKIDGSLLLELNERDNTARYRTPFPTEQIALGPDDYPLNALRLRHCAAALSAGQPDKIDAATWTRLTRCVHRFKSPPTGGEA